MNKKILVITENKINVPLDARLGYTLIKYKKKKYIYVYKIYYYMDSLSFRV